MYISENAYAKINLFLDIESVRHDGYHNILSIMQSVTLHDTVGITYSEYAEKTISVTCDDTNIPCDSQNLAYKAADLFPWDKGKIEIEIKKMIPMSAGLAGGSADAAAVLIALNKIFGNHLTVDELKQLGAKLGADVPFCIEKGCCIATGTGEALKKCPELPDCYIVISKLGEGMSTPEAYRLLDDKYNRFVDYNERSDKLNLIISNKAPSLYDYVNCFFNIFESVVEPIRPSVTLLKDLMKKNGALCAMMSGSGTSVFGIFKEKADATNAVSELEKHNARAYLCSPLS